MIKKLFVLALLTAFLGQNTLAFAAQQGTPTVQQSRQRAQEAVQKMQENSSLSPTFLLSVSAVVVGGLLATAAFQRYSLNLLKKRNELYRKEIFSLQRQLQVSKKEAGDIFENWEKALRLKNDVEKKYWALLEKNKEQQVSAAQSVKSVQESAQQRITNFNRFLASADINKYAALYGKSADEIHALLPKMIQEDLAKVSVPIKSFEVKILAYDLERVLTATQVDQAATIAKAAASSPRYAYGSASFDRFSSKFLSDLSDSLRMKNLFIWGAIVGLGLLTFESQEIGKQLERLQENPSLLLSVTDKQAEVLNESPAARIACSVIADAYESISQLPEKDLQMLMKMNKAMYDPYKKVPSKALAR